MKNQGSTTFLILVVILLLIDGYDGLPATKITANRLGINTVHSQSKVASGVGKKKNSVNDDDEPGNAAVDARYPKVSAKPTGATCGGGIEYEIGFTMNTSTSATPSTGTGFTRVMDVCHNPRLGHTIYAHAKILSIANTGQTPYSRTAFIKGDLFDGIPMSKVYNKNTQRGTIGQILGSLSLAQKYVPDRGLFFFAKGHLIAKADFTYEFYQRATFMYANAVPMWQNVNAGNWKTMETNVRSLAINRKLDLDVWVGSIGILTLKDESAREREIYLHVDNGRHMVPVPKILFKVVYSRAQRSGVVFLTANNPHLTNLTSDFRVCTDICDQISYLTWKPMVATQGLSYCCSVDDFRRASPGIPDFQVNNLLQ